MAAKVDWLTIVGRRQVMKDEWTVMDTYVSASEWLADRMPTFNDVFGRPVDWQVVKPRAPYSYARRSDDATRTLYVHPLSSHFTLEVSGGYCEKIAPYIPAVCQAFEGCFSRFDLAVDMQTKTTPKEFASAITAEVLTRSEMESLTGQTVYIGSRSSDRFTRIYRYNAPHPRAHLLRAEFQLKQAYANACADEIAAGVTLDSLAAGQGVHFGFAHPDWQNRQEPAPLKVKAHAQSGNTVYWLTTTVAPLLKRLQREGKLDVSAWFAEYVTNAD